MALVQKLNTGKNIPERFLPDAAELTNRTLRDLEAANLKESDKARARILIPQRALEISQGAEFSTDSITFEAPWEGAAEEAKYNLKKEIKFSRKDPEKYKLELNSLVSGLLGSNLAQMEVEAQSSLKTDKGKTSFVNIRSFQDWGENDPKAEYFRVDLSKIKDDSDRLKYIFGQMGSYIGRILDSSIDSPDRYDPKTLNTITQIKHFIDLGDLEAAKNLSNTLGWSPQSFLKSAEEIELERKLAEQETLLAGEQAKEKETLNTAEKFNNLIQGYGLNTELGNSLWNLGFTTDVTSSYSPFSNSRQNKAFRDILTKGNYRVLTDGKGNHSILNKDGFISKEVDDPYSPIAWKGLYSNNHLFNIGDFNPRVKNEYDNIVYPLTTNSAHHDVYGLVYNPFTGDMTTDPKLTEFLELRHRKTGQSFYAINEGGTYVPYGVRSKDGVADLGISKLNFSGINWDGAEESFLPYLLNDKNNFTGLKVDDKYEFANWDTDKVVEGLKDLDNKLKGNPTKGDFSSWKTAMAAAQSVLKNPKYANSEKTEVWKYYSNLLRNLTPETQPVIFQGLFDAKFKYNLYQNKKRSEVQYNALTPRGMTAHGMSFSKGGILIPKGARGMTAAEYQQRFPRNTDPSQVVQANPNRIADLSNAWSNAHGGRKVSVVGTGVSFIPVYGAVGGLASLIGDAVADRQETGKINWGTFGLNLATTGLSLVGLGFVGAAGKAAKVGKTTAQVVKTAKNVSSLSGKTGRISKNIKGIQNLGQHTKEVRAAVDYVSKSGGDVSKAISNLKKAADQDVAKIAEQFTELTKGVKVLDKSASGRFANNMRVMSRGADGKFVFTNPAQRVAKSVTDNIDEIAANAKALQQSGAKLSKETKALLEIATDKSKLQELAKTAQATTKYSGSPRKMVMGAKETLNVGRGVTFVPNASGTGYTHALKTTVMSPKAVDTANKLAKIEKLAHINTFSNADEIVKGLHALSKGGARSLIPTLKYPKVLGKAPSVLKWGMWGSGAFHGSVGTGQVISQLWDKDRGDTFGERAKNVDITSLRKALMLGPTVSQGARAYGRHAAAKTQLTLKDSTAEHNLVTLKNKDGVTKTFKVDDPSKMEDLVQVTKVKTRTADPRKWIGKGKEKFKQSVNTTEKQNAKIVKESLKGAKDVDGNTIDMKEFFGTAKKPLTPEVSIDFTKESGGYYGLKDHVTPIRGDLLKGEQAYKQAEQFLDFINDPSQMNLYQRLTHHKKGGVIKANLGTTLYKNFLKENIPEGYNLEWMNLLKDNVLKDTNFKLGLLDKVDNSFKQSSGLGDFYYSPLKESDYYKQLQGIRSTTIPNLSPKVTSGGPETKSGGWLWRPKKNPFENNGNKLQENLPFLVGNLLNTADYLQNEKARKRIQRLNELATVSSFTRSSNIPYLHLPTPTSTAPLAHKMAADTMHKFKEVGNVADFGHRMNTMLEGIHQSNKQLAQGVYTDVANMDKFNQEKARLDYDTRLKNIAVSDADRAKYGKMLSTLYGSVWAGSEATRASNLSNYLKFQNNSLQEHLNKMNSLRRMDKISDLQFGDDHNKFLETYSEHMKNNPLERLSTLYEQEHKDFEEIDKQKWIDDHKDTVAWKNKAEQYEKELRRRSMIMNREMFRLQNMLPYYMQRGGKVRSKSNRASEFYKMIRHDQEMLYKYLSRLIK